MKEPPDSLAFTGKRQGHTICLLLFVSCLSGISVSEAQRRAPSFVSPEPATEEVAQETAEAPLEPPEEESRTDEETPEGSADDTDADETGFWGRMFQPGSTVTRTGSRRSGLTGVLGTQTESGAERPSPQDIRHTPPPTASSRLVIGEIVWVDEDSSIAVGWLASRFAAVDEQLTTRNFELEQTATLRPSPWRQGRSLGLEILSGRPQIGDEIVVNALPEAGDSP